MYLFRKILSLVFHSIYTHCRDEVPRWLSPSLEQRSHRLLLLDKHCAYFIAKKRKTALPFLKILLRN